MHKMSESSLLAYAMNATISAAGLIFCLLGNFQNVSFRNSIRVSNSLDPDQDDVLSDLIWVLTVCKGYQQAKPVGKELIYTCLMFAS